MFGPAFLEFSRVPGAESVISPALESHRRHTSSQLTHPHKQQPSILLSLGWKCWVLHLRCTFLCYPPTWHFDVALATCSQTVAGSV